MGGLRWRYSCCSPILRSGTEPVIETLDHVVDLVRPPAWPSEPVLLIHRQPVGVLHPNIRYPTPTDPTPLRHFARGAICYASRVSPRFRIAALAEHVYDMLGYRFGKYSRSLADCLSPAAVRWVNEVLATNPELLPTERRPFIESHERSDIPPPS